MRGGCRVGVFVTGAGGSHAFLAPVASRGASRRPLADRAVAGPAVAGPRSPARGRRPLAAISGSYRI